MLLASFFTFLILASLSLGPRTLISPLLTCVWFSRSKVSGECRGGFWRACRSTEGKGQDQWCASWPFNRFKCHQEVFVVLFPFFSCSLVFVCINVCVLLRLKGRCSRSRRNLFRATWRNLSSKRKCRGLWISSSILSTVTRISSSESWFPMLLM